MEQKKAKNKIMVYLPLFIVVVAVLVAGVYWYRQYSRYIKTDDAYVDTDNISVSSKMMGHLVNMYFSEGDSVQQGTLLAELDSNDLVAQKVHFLALKKQAEANLIQVKAQYNYSTESIKILEVNYNRASEDFKRAQSQFKGGVIAQEQFDHATHALDAAKAQLDAAKSQLKVSEASIGSANAAVESAGAQIKVIDTQLLNTKLYAPISGLVAKQWLLKGDMAQPGQSVYTITNNNKLWVLVYLEETKIGGVHINQNVIFSIDAFPGETFEGKVFSIGSNTASQFSLIPPSNASGNFTKITQRVPLKISIDKVESQKSLSGYKILAGMSVVVKIIKN